MELRHLRYFVAAADEAHFGRAAERLFVTRPAVSQTISDLEAELGVQLFVRHAQKVALTAAGIALQKSARVLLQELSQAVELAKRIGQGKAGLLTIGYGSLSLLHPLFRAAVKQLGKAFPDIELSLRELPSSDQIPAVSAGKLDAGFVYIAGDAGTRATATSEITSLGDLNSLKIQEGGIAVALPPDHPLAGQEFLELEDLQQENFVVVPHSTVSPSYGRLSSMCMALGFTPRVVQEVANIATQINLISVGIGIGLVVSAPRLQYPSSVTVVPLRNIDYSSEFTLVWRRGQIEPCLQNFIDVVRGLARSQG
jgi:DNA-binding transcriptional LysR family regulator